MGIFNNFFGKNKTAEFDIKGESDRLLKELPPCTTLVVMASPRYSGCYKCEVIAEAGTVADFFEMVFQSTFGGDQSSRVARVTMPVWLRGGMKHAGSGPSYLPPTFSKLVDSYVQDFVNRGDAVVHCPECNLVVSGVNISQRNEKSNTLHSEWTNEWRCPENHLLYTEDHEIEWMRQPSATAQIDPLKVCSDLASRASIAAVLDKGDFSGFLVYTGVSSDEFTKATKHKDALQKFVKIIELRIKHRDFENQDTTNYANLGLPEPKRNMDAPRVVLDQNEKALFNWKRDA